MAPGRLEELELPRAVWHALAVSTWGVAALLARDELIPFLTPRTYTFLVWWAFGLMVFWEALRRRYGSLNRLPGVRALLRSGERGREVTTAVYFLLGLVVCVNVFSLTTTAAAVFVTGCADPSARIIGKAFGKHRLPRSRKTVEGSLACFAVTFLIVYIVGRSPASALSAGVLVTAAELFIPQFLPGFLDDNFWIPMACGLAMDWTPYFLQRLGGL